MFRLAEPASCSAYTLFPDSSLPENLTGPHPRPFSQFQERGMRAGEVLYNTNAI